MRILADRHHADLYYAIQRLFEDRLGVEVFTPVGRAWWDEEIWGFGRCFGDDRLARQYLDIHDGVWALQADGSYVTFDSAHPDRPIKGVTLEWARDAGWSFVMPSVQENQIGFHKFAQQTGARYLYNVGNTGQQISWDLDPLVLSNSEMPILGKGVVLHQEIESEPGGMYEWCSPLSGECSPVTVRNFVNAFNRIPGYDAFLEAETLLGPAWEFTIHGHEGRDGDIQPASAVAKLMRSAGWGWQDKPVGDGFGHVIHSWAAVGRPLIGHARYYQGKMASPFWRHGETCIDLDQVSIPEAVHLVREWNGTSHHVDMCQAIREVFDQHVDYEAEAAAVAALIGLTP